MFDRTKDPNNLEELMIAEYYRRVDDYENLQAKYEIDKLAAAADYNELMDLLKAEEAKSARLQSIIDKDEGVVDLHEPILLYRSKIAGEYYFKDWLESHAEDEGPDEGIEAYIAAINKNDDACIEWFEEHGKRSYSKLIKIEKKTFKYTLQIPGYDTMAYDPQYSSVQLLTITSQYADDRWVNMPLELFKKCVAAEIRRTANKAYKEYKNDLAKKAAEETES